MDLEMLCRAFQETRPWLDHFRLKTYPKAFQAYTKRFGPVYEAAVRQAGDEAALRALAETVLDGIEAGWKKQRPWNRGAVQVEEKQMAVDYLAPMLLRSPLPECRTLCTLLQDGWAARWPKDAYQTAGYEALLGGFRNTVMGIELPKRRGGRESE